MILNRRAAGALAALALCAASGCGGLHSNEPAMQIYTIEPTYSLPKAENPGGAGSVQVLRPLAAPGLDTDRIALRRSGQRLDYYSASRWPAPLPEFVQSLVVDALRAAGRFRAVQPDNASFSADSVLQIEIGHCSADYPGDGPPTVRVKLLATYGPRAERATPATLSAESSVAASENRMQAVVAAFQGALSAALSDLAGRLPP